MFKYCVLAATFALLTALSFTPVSADEPPQIISEIVEVRVYEATEFIFTPTATGYWTFITSDNEGDPRLWIYNMYGMLIVTDDDSGGNLNAHIVVHLVEGVDYIVEASFFGRGTGSYTLSVYMVDRFERPGGHFTAVVVEIPSEGGIIEAYWNQEWFSFTPNTTGLWTFELANVEYLELIDSFDNHLAWLDFWDTDYEEGTITVHLVEGVEYLISIWAAWHSDDFTIAVSQTDMFTPWLPLDEFAEAGFVVDTDVDFMQIPRGGGFFSVNDVAGFSFVPDHTGAWAFTAEGSYHNIYLALSDIDTSFFAFTNWWNDDLVVYLAEGTQYFIWVLEEVSWDYVAHYAGSFTLTVEPYTVTEIVQTSAAQRQIPAISSSGGMQEVSWDNSQFSFAPSTTSTWTLQAGPFVDDLSITDASNSFWLSAWGNNVITVDLAAGVEYFVHAEMWWWGEEACAIIITPHYSIEHFTADAATVRNVVRESEFSLVPDETGMWIIRTANNGNSDPVLQILDANGNVIAEDDDSGEGLNALIKIELTAGQRYTIHAGFFAGSTGQYQLLVSRLITEMQERPRLVAPEIINA